MTNDASSAERASDVAMRPPHCPICGGKDQISKCCSVGGFEIYSCELCQGDFVSPTPSEIFLRDFYSREAWFEGGEPGGYKNYDEQTAGSVQALEGLLANTGEQPGRVLDVGCGYGTHLEYAARCGWTCFGVEISAHARGIAQQRLVGKAVIGAAFADLPAQSYDLVLLLDVIEHLGDPWPMFEDLIQRGAITAFTKIVVTTPNARSDEALKDPAGWQFRHPPSHLTYYSAVALDRFLSRVGFARVEVTGLHATRSAVIGENDLAQFAGLLAVASQCVR